MIRRNFKPEAALIAFAATFAVVSADPSMALTAKECSVKYKAAKAAGTLNGLGWNDFRKKECEGAGETTNQKAATTDAKSFLRMQRQRPFSPSRSIPSTPRRLRARRDFIRVLISTEPTRRLMATAE